MPKPIEFASRSDLLNAALSPAYQAAFGEFFQQRFPTVEAAVVESVGNNTFRAFHFNTAGITGLKPSGLYREWTIAWLSANVSKLTCMKNRGELRQFVVAGAHALDTHWTGATAGRNRIGFGRAAKLLNLSVKHIVCLATISDADHERLIPLLDVPLDSFTLVGVRRLLPELAIPASATMKFVKDEAHYVQIQDAITRLCAPECLPVQYEIASWNLSHGYKAKSL